MVESSSTRIFVATVLRPEYFEGEAGDVLLRLLGCLKYLLVSSWMALRTLMSSGPRILLRSGPVAAPPSAVLGSMSRKIYGVLGVVSIVIVGVVSVAGVAGFAGVDGVVGGNE